MQRLLIQIMRSRMIIWMKVFACALTLGVSQFTSSAQETTPNFPNEENEGDNSLLDTNIIHLVHADTSLWEIFDDSTIQTYNGQVIIYHDSAFMYCDSAYIRDSVYMRAYENIIIQQGDSLQIFADTMIYSAEERQAELFGEVILVNGGQKLFTDYLQYDLEQKVARYFTESTLTDDETFLTSHQGVFYVEDELAFFKDSVQVVGPDFQLRTDSLEYQTEIKTVYFLGPTLINQDDKRIYCESGFYDVPNEFSTFSEHAQFSDQDAYAEADVIQYNRKDGIVELQGDAYYREGDRTASGDYILYDETNEWLTIKGNGIIVDSTKTVYSDDMFYDVAKDSFAVMDRSVFYNDDQKLEADQLRYNNNSGEGVAWGNVIWIDTINELGIVCDSLLYDNSKNQFVGLSVQNRPMMWNMIDGDSMFIKADTLYMAEIIKQGDTIMQMEAYHDVRIYKSDLQGLGDSLVYNEIDSAFTLFGDPILWADTSQFTADTIDIILKERKLHTITLNQNAFIINSPDELFFNQIKGRIINAYFREDNLYLMHVHGNAETIYYILDDLDAYIGVNKSTCSQIKIFFGNNQVKRIVSYKEVDSSLHPMKEVDHATMILTGYKWQEDKRPKSKYDLDPPKLVLK